MINKHCLSIFIDPEIPYEELVAQFIIYAEQKYKICHSVKDADIVISTKKLTDKIHVIISNGAGLIELTEHDYNFQPFLNGHSGNIDALSKELCDFVHFIVRDYDLPYKKDNTILIVR